jgi:transposase
MSLALQPLPTEPDALRAYALALQTNLATLETEHQTLQNDYSSLRDEHHFLKQEAAANKNELYEKSLMVEKLRGELATLKRNHFGRSSEKVDRRIDQLEFLLEELEIDVAQINARKNGQKREHTADRQPAKESHERRQFPAHWPRERIEHCAFQGW